MYVFTEYMCMLGCAYFIISCAYDLFKWAQCEDLEKIGGKYEKTNFN